MTRYSIPQPLKVGDKGVIVSPAGAVDGKYIDGAINVLSEWGIRMEAAPHARGCYGRFSGTPEERLSDLQDAMDDVDNRLIFCSRGGYGAVHLLEKLNFDKLKESPKWLVGYSDITALHQLFLHHKLASLHAPMAKHLTEDAPNAASGYLNDILFGRPLHYTLESHPLNLAGETDGALFGGNMAVFYSLLATPCTTVPRDGILFLEDIGERPYQIDRMLWTLKLSGIFGRIKGLLVGHFTDCAEDPLMFRSIYELIRGMVEKYNIPVAFGFPVGHTAGNYPLIHGGKVKLTVGKQQVELKF
ncbi:MAG: LD-carboxypeptidase [Prevotella sp.]|nr:LD-carboxypeptidase [Prevotella sp.]